MNGKTILWLAVIGVCLSLNLQISAEPYNVTGKPIMSMDQNTGIEEKRYIAVDKNRVIDPVAKGQQVTDTEKLADKSKYNIDIENWKEPGASDDTLAPNHRNVNFNMGTGADRDLISQCDASRNGSRDARQIHYHNE